MLCSGIRTGGCTDIHIIENGTSTVRRYADEILKSLILPCVAANGIPLFEWMIIKDCIQFDLWSAYLKGKQYSVQKRACSPDLNPTENFRDEFGRRIVTRPITEFTIRDFDITLPEEFHRILKSHIDNLKSCMENWYATVLAIRRDHSFLVVFN